MLDALNKTDTTEELPLDTRTKAKRIEEELRINSARSDREIGRIVGCDGKTVAAVRARQSPNPTEFRAMLIAGGKDFDAKNPPETAEERADRMMAEGKIKHATAGTGGAIAMGMTMETDADDFNWNNDDSIVVKEQIATAIYYNNYGELVIRQKAGFYDENDHIIIITKPALESFIDQLHDRLGVISIPGAG